VGIDARTRVKNYLVSEEGKTAWLWGEDTKGRGLSNFGEKTKSNYEGSSMNPKRRRGTSNTCHLGLVLVAIRKKGGRKLSSKNKWGNEGD